MADDIRISENFTKFHDYMKRTDLRQLTVLLEPDTLRFTLYQWTPEESEAWTTFRQRTETLFALYSNPDTVGPAVRKKMKELIKEVRKYDNDPAEGHHLLDLVAIRGDMDDWLTFNVKKNTPLAQNTNPNRYHDELAQPLVVILKNTEGVHVIGATNPATPETTKLPRGAKLLLVHRYIGTQPPANLNDFTLLGAAKRGRIVSNFNPGELDTKQKLYAWYYACYKFKSGKHGRPSEIVRAQIVVALA